MINLLGGYWWDTWGNILYMENIGETTNFRWNTEEKLKAHPGFGTLFFLGFFSSRIPPSCFLRRFFITRSSPSFIFYTREQNIWLINMVQKQLQTYLIISCAQSACVLLTMWSYLEVIILGACIFSLRVRCCSELQRARVDVEASVFCGERSRYQLVVLRPGEKYNYC